MNKKVQPKGELANRDRRGVHQLVEDAVAEYLGFDYNQNDWGGLEDFEKSKSVAYKMRRLVARAALEQAIILGDKGALSWDEDMVGDDSYWKLRSHSLEGKEGPLRLDSNNEDHQQLVADDVAKRLLGEFGNNRIFNGVFRDPGLSLSSDDGERLRNGLIDRMVDNEIARDDAEQIEKALRGVMYDPLFSRDESDIKVEDKVRSEIATLVNTAFFADEALASGEPEAYFREMKSLLEKYGKKIGWQDLTPAVMAAEDEVKHVILTDFPAQLPQQSLAEQRAYYGEWGIVHTKLARAIDESYGHYNQLANGRYLDSTNEAHMRWINQLFNMEISIENACREHDGLKHWAGVFRENFAAFESQVGVSPAEVLAFLDPYIQGNSHSVDGIKDTEMSYEDYYDSLSMDDKLANNPRSIKFKNDTGGVDILDIGVIEVPRGSGNSWVKWVKEKVLRKDTGIGQVVMLNGEIISWDEVMHLYQPYIPIPQLELKYSDSGRLEPLDRRQIRTLKRYFKKSAIMLAKSVGAWEGSSIVEEIDKRRKLHSSQLIREVA